MLHVILILDVGQEVSQGLEGRYLNLVGAIIETLVKDSDELGPIAHQHVVVESRFAGNLYQVHQGELHVGTFGTRQPLDQIDEFLVDFLDRATLTKKLQILTMISQHRLRNMSCLLGFIMVWTVVAIRVSLSLESLAMVSLASRYFFLRRRAPMEAT